MVHCLARLNSCGSDGDAHSGHGDQLAIILMARKNNHSKVTQL